MSGASPPGVHGEEQTARWVRRMFDGVAPSYDLLNHLLSLNVDRYWRWRTVKRVEPILRRPDARAADLCCGSGDLLIAMQRRASARLFGFDFSHEMLKACRAKLANAALPSLVFEADALALPVASGSLDLVTAAFGFRNLVNYARGLAEVARVLKPGGVVAILEFTTPPNRAFRRVYDLYSLHVLPRIGAAISGSPEAYSYLPESVRKFPAAPDFARSIAEAGFDEVEFQYLTFGIVALHTAKRRAW